MIRSANNAVAFSLPVLASVLSFVTYSLSGHELTASVIFTSLTLFQLLRMPLMFLPMSLSAAVDAKNAIDRINGVFEAELLAETQAVNMGLDAALDVQGAQFQWDGAPPAEVAAAQKKSKWGAASKRFSRAMARKSARPSAAPTPAVGTPKDEEPQEGFALRDITMSIPRGQLVAIVGPVGTGKTSLLEGLIGEMRKTTGTVQFGGSVGYCPQSAWIQNATIRENVCFGRPFEEERYWKAVQDSCLEPDLEMLPFGDLTEVGEKVD